MNSDCLSCGGCLFRNLKEEEYREKKISDFISTINRIKGATPVVDESIFIADGLRRRADMEFSYDKKQLILGFNEEKSHNLININKCMMLCPELNNLLEDLHQLLAEFCQIPISIKDKKKIKTEYIKTGSVYMLKADNGIDILLRLFQMPTVEHRMLLAEFINSKADVIRVSWQIKNTEPETIAEKISPQLYIADYTIPIPQGAFLQASKASEIAMISKVMEYMGETTGKIADLFCGLGTFTYPLAKNKQNEIISVDSSENSLKGLQKALNYNQIHNVTVVNRNLFKYPFDSDDLSGINALVMDPPRAGAHEQCREIEKLEANKKPKKIVFVSCNPKTFVYDAELLINAGYALQRITLIDQFVYSGHQELVALFTIN